MHTLSKNKCKKNIIERQNECNYYYTSTLIIAVLMVNNKRPMYGNSTSMEGGITWRIYKYTYLRQT